MQPLSAARLFEDTRERLQLAWLAGEEHGRRELDGARIQRSSQGLIGHLNLIHPNWIQVLSPTELQHLEAQGAEERLRALGALASADTFCVLVTEAGALPAEFAEFARTRKIPVLGSPLPSTQVMWILRPYLSRALAESTQMHGVLLDVLDMGVLITGASGVGKSELALELVSRGHGLVADDVVDVYRIAPHIIEGRCPPMLKDFLEVRGLGMLDIRTIFGETAVRVKKNVKLIVELQRASHDPSAGVERLPLRPDEQVVLGVPVRKVILPVAAGRNLAVLTEAAVRSFVLELRGIDSTQAFIRRQQDSMTGGEAD
ncbi:MAG: HPr(Ser) kinase/phosphatase [Pseudomonadota bacterium]|jgi:HPr kinase/phosphorylase